MAIQIQLRQGTTTEHNSFTGALGEVTYDTTKKTVVVHDGTTVGGTALAKVSEVPSLVPQATEAVAGKAKIATTAIAQAGVNDTDIITAKKLRDALNAGGNAPCYAARAFVTFNASTGTPNVSASGNVTSITDNGIGDFTINFTTAMPDANYAVAGVTGNNDVTSNPAAASIRAQTGAITTTSCRVRTANHFTNSGASAYDMPYNSVIIFR